MGWASKKIFRKQWTITRMVLWTDMPGLYSWWVHLEKQKNHNKDQRKEKKNWNVNTFCNSISYLRLVWYFKKKLRPPPLSPYPSPVLTSLCCLFPPGLSLFVVMKLTRIGGLLYEESGYGIERSITKACENWQKAASQQHSGALKKLDRYRVRKWKSHLKKALLKSSLNWETKRSKVWCVVNKREIQQICDKNVSRKKFVLENKTIFFSFVSAHFVEFCFSVFLIFFSCIKTFFFFSVVRFL